MRKIKKLLLIIGIFFIASTTIFLNTSFGKLLTIKYRGYTEISENVYWDNKCSSDKTVFVEILNQSQARLVEFWGNAENNAIFIISDNPENLNKLGLSVKSVMTKTFVFNGAISYIAVNIDKADIDVLSHEMSHAELHKRIYQNKFVTTQLVPVWFDEGLAMQIDYREKYSENAWIEMNETLSDPIYLSDIESAEHFFNEDDVIRMNNYILSRHEISDWLLTHGFDGLQDLINGIQNDVSFESLYFR